MSETTTSNKLGQENSFYLKQHADQPIHWYPYGDEALELARQQNRPILLSIGYSSCHWCHVMSDESFSDQEIADIINKNFIAIKVDREEYPDLDSYYQQASQLYIKSGGWPLNAFLTPDMKPFFVGTYFPKVAKEKGASFKDLLSELVRAYSEDKERIDNNANSATQALEKEIMPEEKIEFPDHFPAPMAIINALKEHVDLKNGGHGLAPKFPHFAYYEWCVEQLLEGTITQEDGSYVIKTIDAMLLGGLYDHARGGIHRYSTDEKFLVPHFEKMLYDQAGLLRLLAKTSRLYQAPHVFDAIMDTLDYLASEMLSESGHMMSAQDADSEGVEGLYFTFTKEEFEAIVNQASNDKDDLTEMMSEFLAMFQITPQGNFDRGLNVISLNLEMKDKIFTSSGWENIRRIRHHILQARSKRIPPMTDRKGIASWNSHLISGLLDVMQYCPIDVIRQRASELFEQMTEGYFKTFISRNSANKVQLKHTTTIDRQPSYFEDYVFFAESQIRTYELTGNIVFKDNFKDTMEYIDDEFTAEDNFVTRSLSHQDKQAFPNHPYSYFDSSFKSAAATYLGLINRARILFKDLGLYQKTKQHSEKAKQNILMNPLAAGEGLRAMTYPQEVYRVLTVPKTWLQETKFLEFTSQLMPRFVLDFDQDETSQTWQLCNHQSCELTGTGIDEFIKALTPSDAPEAAAPND
jgi:uncharacterized protein YyaL (SSP411 family)